MTPEVAAARADADLKRQRALATLGELKHRVAPSTVARQTGVALRDRAEHGVDVSIDAIEGRPRIAAAIAGGVLLLVLRRPVVRIVRRIFRRRPSGEPITVPAEPKRH